MRTQQSLENDDYVSLLQLEFVYVMLQETLIFDNFKSTVAPGMLAGTLDGFQKTCQPPLDDYIYINNNMFKQCKLQGFCLNLFFKRYLVAPFFFQPASPGSNCPVEDCNTGGFREVGGGLVGLIQAINLWRHQNWKVTPLVSYVIYLYRNAYGM